MSNWLPHSVATLCFLCWPLYDASVERCVNVVVKLDLKSFEHPHSSYGSGSAHRPSTVSLRRFQYWSLQRKIWLLVMEYFQGSNTSGVLATEPISTTSLLTSWQCVTSTGYHWLVPPGVIVPSMKAWQIVQFACWLRTIKGWCQQRRSICLLDIDDDHCWESRIRGVTISYFCLRINDLFDVDDLGNGAT